MHDQSVKAAFAEAQRNVNSNLKKLDILKPRIKKKYELYVQRRRESEARRATLQGELRNWETIQSRDTPIPYSGQHLEASQNKDLAIKLAHTEISRRAAVRSAGADQDRLQEGESQKKSSKSQSNLLKAADEDDDHLSRQLQEVAARVEPQRGITGPDRVPERKNIRSAEVIATYKYPTVPANHVGSIPETSVKSRLGSHAPAFEQAYQSIPPQVPPKPSIGIAEDAPFRPEKSSGTSSVDVSSRPTAYTFAPAAYLENGAPLRTLFLPPTLRTTFLRVAHKNTLANLETCAFLAGTLISNALFVSKLIVPAQTSTSDTCEMTNESQLFDYVDSASDLMILGWIHTHPTQTCFMSSRDLHTHAGYQMMLAESVAIVCAPSKGDTSHGGEWGVYRLTDPPGKKAILACEKPGLFHPHDVEHIYTDALRPGHVVEAKGLEFELVDLREREN